MEWISNFGHGCTESVVFTSLWIQWNNSIRWNVRRLSSLFMANYLWAIRFSYLVSCDFDSFIAGMWYEYVLVAADSRQTTPVRHGYFEIQSIRIQRKYPYHNKSWITGTAFWRNNLKCTTHTTYDISLYWLFRYNYFLSKNSACLQIKQINDEPPQQWPATVTTIYCYKDIFIHDYLLSFQYLYGERNEKNVMLSKLHVAAHSSASPPPPPPI